MNASRSSQMLPAQPDSIHTSPLNLGSLKLRLHTNNLDYARLIEAFFRIRIDWDTPQPPAQPLDFDLSIIDVEALPVEIEIDNQLVITPLANAHGYDVRTDIAHGIIDASHTPGLINILIEAAHDAEVKQHHFRIVFFRMLYLMRRVLLHAAAVRCQEKTCLFVADKGSGKSTLTLALALNGGIVLGEDHVLLNQSDKVFTLSGCDETMRLTAQSEQYFFDQPLPIAARDYAGVLKKEIRLADYVTCRPYQDFPIDALFFPVIGDTFSIETLSRKEAMQRLMRDMPWYHRFTGIADQMDFIGYFANLVETVDVYTLRLSRDLNDLSQLIAWLEEYGA